MKPHWRPAASAGGSSRAGGHDQRAGGLAHDPVGRPRNAPTGCASPGAGPRAAGTWPRRPGSPSTCRGSTQRSTWSRNQASPPSSRSTHMRTGSPLGTCTQHWLSDPARMTNTGGSIRRQGGVAPVVQGVPDRVRAWLTSTSRAVSTASDGRRADPVVVAGLVPVLDSHAVGPGQLDQLRAGLDPLGLHDRWPRGLRSRRSTRCGLRAAPVDLPHHGGLQSWVGASPGSEATVRRDGPGPVPTALGACSSG